MQVFVHSTVPLTSSQRSQLTKAVIAKYGKDVEVMETVDTRLIAGLTVTVGSRQVDGSLHGKVTALQTALTEKGL